MSCNADIETETVQSVLSVPIQSVTARVSEDKEEEMKNGDNNQEEKKRKLIDLKKLFSLLKIIRLL
jgi:hypothetical protein